MVKIRMAKKTGGKKPRKQKNTVTKFPAFRVHPQRWTTLLLRYLCLSKDYSKTPMYRAAPEWMRGKEIEFFKIHTLTNSDCGDIATITVKHRDTNTREVFTLKIERSENHA